MQKLNISFKLTVFESIKELSRVDSALMMAAVEARKNAYAPYSNFLVGAALSLANGRIVIGNNQENACYPAGLCAERVAIFQAGALYPGVTVEAIAISASSNNHIVDHPAAPCGNCRQSISEYEVKQESPISIMFMGEVGEIYQCDGIADLLPLAFSNSFLK